MTLLRGVLPLLGLSAIAFTVIAAARVRGDQGPAGASAALQQNGAPPPVNAYMPRPTGLSAEDIASLKGDMARLAVINSGFTFHDPSSHSRQSPKLPDWAVVNVTEPGTRALPMSVTLAGFFDERWRLGVVPAAGRQ